MSAAPPPSDDGFRQLFERLRRRKLVQWAVAYLTAAWLVLQVVDVIADPFGWSDALQRVVALLLAVGFLATLVLAYFHGEKGRQRVSGTELLLLAVVLLVGGAALRLARTPPQPTTALDTSEPAAPLVDSAAIMVAPFSPGSPDSALARLGRDLVVTTSATLDGIGGIRTVDALTVLAAGEAGASGTTLPQARTLARRLGVGRFLHGTLAPSAGGVRVDAALYDVAAAAPTARVTVTGGPLDLEALTDSLTLAIVRTLWREDAPVAPGLATVRTGSVPALRAYLRGEQALARHRMVAAIEAFEEAFAHDSTFWFAYWRSLYPRAYGGDRADSVVLTSVVEHRHELAEPDRRLVEAWLEPTVSARLERLRALGHDYPHYWPAWFEYADLLVHHGPHIGTTRADARAALERVLMLNPGFATAWRHLFWMVAADRDVAAVDSVLAVLERFQSEETQLNAALLHYYRSIQQILHNGRLPPEQFRDLVTMITDYRGAIPPDAFATGLPNYGFYREQIRVADSVHARGPGPAMLMSMWKGKALSWAGRGNWDSAAVAVQHWVRSSDDPEEALGGYGLLVAGAAAGATSASIAARFRPELAPDAAPETRAELAWLDGVLAHARRDRAALRRARSALAAATEAFGIDDLRRSLAALERDLSGDRAGAASDLEAAELDAAEHFRTGELASRYPHLETVDRVLAGRWLLALGETARAGRLLSWYECMYVDAEHARVVGLAIGQLTLPERAAAAEAMGRNAQAREYRARYTRTYDARPLSAQPPSPTAST